MNSRIPPRFVLAALTALRATARLAASTTGTNDCSSTIPNVNGRAITGTATITMATASATN